jgi:hypothetical protein
VNPAHLPDTESLMAIVLDGYDQASPGLRAKVEQVAAEIADYFRGEGLPLTVDGVRDHFGQVVWVGIVGGVGPETPAADMLGMELAGSALLARQTAAREAGG